MAKEPLNVFISYARKDEQYLNDFKLFLTGMVRDGSIHQWNDRSLEAGDLWDDGIMNALAAADIIVFLVSQDFIASEYIQKVEIKTAIENYEKGISVIVPVVIRTCDFSSLPISKFQALPKNLQPVATWDHQEEAWMDVVKSLRRLVEKLQSREKKQVQNLKTAKASNAVMDEPNSNLEAIRQRVVNGELGSAIQDLLKISKVHNSDLYNTAILLSSRFNSSKKNEMQGLVTDGESTIAKAKIVQSILYLIDQLENRS